MPATKATKRFLDTSVLRPMLHGASAYKRYLQEQLGNDPCYISQYVMMEFRRSFILNIVAFYFVLELPAVETVGDALRRLFVVDDVARGREKDFHLRKP